MRIEEGEEEEYLNLGGCGGEGKGIVNPAARGAATEQLTSYQMEPLEQKVEHGSAVWSSLFGVVSCLREEEESTFALVNHIVPIRKKVATSYSSNVSIWQLTNRVRQMSLVCQ